MRHLRSLALLGALGLLAALIGAPVARAEAAVDVTPRILEMEQLGRAKPTDTAVQLQRLQSATTEHSPQRLELLTVQGLMLAVTAQREAAEAPTAALEAWGREADVPHTQQAGAAALLVRARGIARDGNLRRAETMLQEAVNRLPSTVSERERYRFVIAQAAVANELGKVEQAVRLGHEALELADRQNALWCQSEARTTLATAYFAAKQPERAQKLIAESKAMAESTHDWVSLGRAQTTEIFLEGEGTHEAERILFEAAIANARRAGAKYDEVRYVSNLSDFFLKTGDYKTALAQSLLALPIARELHDVNSETVALANAGLAHISMQHIEIGKKYVAEAVAIDKKRGSMSGVSSSLVELGMYLEKAGDLPSAIAAYHEYRRIATNLLRDDHQKAILAMQEQYDADKRSRALTLLARENDIKAEQLRRRDLQQRLWWLLAALFVLSFAVVALLYRRVRETNRLLSSSNDLLKVQSERDPLTGLANRRHFQAVMRKRAADGKLAGTVYLIDVDHFKHINDRHGHGAGDLVLVEVARRLRDTLREQDLIVRWGGEEFLVVVQSLGAEQIDALAQRMLAVLDGVPVTCGAEQVPISASIGFATFPIGPSSLSVSWERAIDLVDTAMYLAKAHGRNRAYGVRLRNACDETALSAITSSLEASWREGKVELTLLQSRSEPAPTAEAA